MLAEMDEEFGVSAVVADRVKAHPIKVQIYLRCLTNFIG